MVSGRVLTSVLLPLAVRHVSHRALVVGVAVVGLACGVAALAATRLLHRSVVDSYEATVRRFAGNADLEVGNGDSGVPEDLIDEVRSVAGVRAVVASVEGFVTVPDFPGERLYLFGIDLLADQDVRDYGAGAAAVVSDPMVFLAAADSVALTDQFVRRCALALHDRIRVLTPSGTAELTVRAVLGRQAGPASALDGRLAVVDLSIAQSLMQLDDRVSRLAIEVETGADRNEVGRRVAAVVGSRGVVEPPRARVATFARLLAGYGNAIVAAAMVAMLVALHFVANLATIAVEERRREMALLRAVGAPSGFVATLVTGEMLIVALCASAIGVPLGVGLARLLLARFSAGVSALYGDVGPATLHVDAMALAGTAALGVLATLIATLVPVRRALSILPVEALRAQADAGPRLSRGAARAGFSILVATLALWFFRGRLPVSDGAAGMVTVIGVLVGVAIALPAIARVFAAALERLVCRRGEVALLLMARWVREERRPFAVTCAAMTFGLAGSIAVATWISSLDATLHEAFDAVFGHVDLVVSSGADPLAAEAVRMPAAIRDELAAWPEVAFVDAVRLDTVSFADSRAAIVSRDATAYVEGRRTLFMIEGDAETAASRLRAGTGVVINSTFAHRFGRHPGDVLEMATPGGLLRLPIVGIHLELAPGDLGVIELDRAVYRRWWRDDSVSLVEIGLRRSGDRSRVVSAIRARWGAKHALVVFTTEELLRTYEAMLRRLAGLVAPVLAVAIVCALTGIVSASTAAVLVRRRTYAMLRAVGCSGREVTRATVLELVAIASLAVSGALLIAPALGWLQVEVMLRGMLGLAVDYAFPIRLAAASAGAVLSIAMLTGFVLGRAAVRTPIRTMLHAE